MKYYFKCKRGTISKVPCYMNDRPTTFNDTNNDISEALTFNLQAARIFYITHINCIRTTYGDDWSYNIENVQ